MPKSLLIHHRNVVDTGKFDTQIIFESTGNVDTYVQTKILPELEKAEFDIIFIKDNLSSNYLELYGIALVYHIRLSRELGDKRFVPIGIISDIDACVLNRLDVMANILFTENIFLVSNQTEQISYFIKKTKEHIDKLDEKRFLSAITVEPPKETSHDIANEWAMYKWATLLDVKTDATMENKNSIKSMLYFKYLLAFNPVDEVKALDQKRPKSSGKILYIDDEWARGWKDILEVYFHNTDVGFETFEKDFKDAKSFSLRNEIKEKVKLYDPDLVLLDLRLVANDHTDTKRENIEMYTGIQVREAIKEVNPGIQVIMFTATSKSLILEKLYEHNILGYIKKEHPLDINISTKENITKLALLIDKGMEKKYLKEVWEIQERIMDLSVLKEVTLTYGEENKLLELKNSIPVTFEILNSNIPRPFVYGMFSIYKCIEIICEYYIEEHHDSTTKKYKGYWRGTRTPIDNNKSDTSTNNKTKQILKKLAINDDLNDSLNKIVCSRNYEIHGGEIKYNCQDYVIKIPGYEDIIDWFTMLETILVGMNISYSNKAGDF